MRAYRLDNTGEVDQFFDFTPVLMDASYIDITSYRINEPIFLRIILNSNESDFFLNCLRNNKIFYIEIDDYLHSFLQNRDDGYLLCSICMWNWVSDSFRFSMQCRRVEWEPPKCGFCRWLEQQCYRSTELVHNLML